MRGGEGILGKAANVSKVVHGLIFLIWHFESVNWQRSGASSRAQSLLKV